MTTKGSGEGATPRPWKVCGDGKCACLIISGKDHPITEITTGDWGDFYESVRLVKIDGQHAPVAQAFKDGLAYGHVPVEVARANAALIVEAVNNHDRLTKENERLRAERDALAETAAKYCRLLNSIWGTDGFIPSDVSDEMDALFPPCGDCGDDGEKPNLSCPTCKGTGYKPLALEGR